MAARKGVLLVISAPSGTGKSTLVRGLLERMDGVEFSVSFTTRKIRAGERDGRDYHFIDRERFDSMIRSGEFLEYADVFEERYGTGRSVSLDKLASGSDLILDIDIQGGRQLRASGIAAVSVFILPPGFSTLKSRLLSRGTDSEEQITARLSMARSEAEEVKYYDYVVVNDDIASAVDQLITILSAERLKVSRRGPETEEILSSFPSG